MSDDSETKRSTIWLILMALCLLVTPFIYGNLKTFGTHDIEALGQLFIWIIVFSGSAILYIRSDGALGIFSKAITLISSLVYSSSVFILFNVRNQQVDWDQLSPQQALLISFFVVLNIGAFAYLAVVFAYAKKNKKSFIASLHECRKLYGIRLTDMVAFFIPVHKKANWPLLIIAICYLLASRLKPS